MNRPTPIDAAREFKINEMFFSTTDRTGRILSGNDVFVRVSDYELAQLIGQPHNTIRHPDTPRAVFRLVWDFLENGRPVAGFIKNLARDGRYYWVVAFLMPIRGGYLSIRFKPSGPLLEVVQRIYQKAVACEQEQEKAGADRKAAMAASEALLLAALRESGFENYEAFMRTMLHQEMKARDALLGAHALQLFPRTLGCDRGSSAEADILHAIFDEGLGVYAQINTLYAQLDEFASLNDNISAKSAVVLEQTRDFRFIAFNAALRSSRLGEEARGLGVIAEYLGTTSARTGDLVGGLVQRIGAVTAKLRAVIFNLAAARLQIEMVLSFCSELSDCLTRDLPAGADAAQMRRQMVRDLQQAFTEVIERAVRALAELDLELRQLGGTAEELRRNVLTLQVAQVGGQVEASRLRDDDAFSVMFADLRGRVDATKSELGNLNDISSRLAELSAETPTIAAAIAATVASMERQVQAFSACETVAKAAAPAAPRSESLPAAA